MPSNHTATNHVPSKATGPGEPRRVSLVIFGFALIAVGLVAPAGPAAAGTITGQNRDQSQIVQFNTYGGLGNATSGFNERINFDILDSIGSRNHKPNFLSLNEVCEQGYNILVWVLTGTGSGYSTSNPSGYTFHHTVSLGQFFGGQIGSDLDDDCGAWYGNALLMRGAQVSGTGGEGWYSSSIQGPSSYGELRNWMCRKSAWSNTSYCSTHTTPLCRSDSTVPQIAAFRDIANYASSGGVYALGDLNCPPYLAGWAGAGFNEIEYPSPTGIIHHTTDAGFKYDYIWKKNATFSAAPYIFEAARSDHHWVQAYP
ncbi:MAG TPA: hypothetical protein VNQ33_05135 [Acidimicrobiales bacterium]|nr:hypothetical protein [Acidimicrobiales bacterium]